jgi:GNAT superfamily N-acetyltransferase
MDLIRYESSLAEDVAAAYSSAFAGVPHCYPVDAVDLDAAIRQASGGPIGAASGGSRVAHPRILLSEGAAWAAVERGRVVGFCHVAVGDSKPDYDEASPVERAGGVRTLFFDRGERAVGGALLDAAEAHLRAEGVARIDAYHFDHRLPFHHVEHSYLSARLEHVHALLGARGYVPGESEVNLDWPAFAAPDPGDPPATVTIRLEWGQGAGERPSLILHATAPGDEEREVGICVNLCVGDGTPAPEAQDWVYTAWLHVAEEHRGAGLGRYLMRRALHELRQVGYTNATICSISNNYRALLLYSGLGYHSVDWTTFWRKRVR